MSKLNIIHQLIKSLTKSEKRFIKLNAQMHKGDKVYLTLMDAIAKQKDYDEDELLIMFKNEDFIKQFSVAKNYLQNFILKQLRQYYSGLRASIECKNLLIDIEILFWKGQYKLAEKIIAKTEKIAIQYELFLILEELSYWNERIYSALLKLDKNSVKNTKEKHHDNLKKYLNILDYEELRNQTVLLIKQSEVIRDKKELNEYNKLLNNPLLKDKKNAQSYYALYMYNVLNSVLQRVIGNVDESAKYRDDLLALIESNPYLIKENPIQYTAAIHNILKETLIEKDFEKFEEYLAKLKGLDLKMPHEKANVFSKLCIFELRYFISHNEHKKAIDFIENTVVEFGDVNSILNKEHSFLLNYHATQAYFYLEDYNIALKWMNKVINEPSKDLRIDVRASAYVFNILIHYELDNLEILPYLVKSTLHFFKSHKLNRKIDEFFISMLKSIPSKKNRKDLVQFLELKKVEISKIKENSIAVLDLNYMEWIDSKIKGVPLSEIAKNKKEILS